MIIDYIDFDNDFIFYCTQPTSEFSTSELTSILDGLTYYIMNKPCAPIDFDDNSMSDNDYYKLTGLKAFQFSEICETLKGINYSPVRSKPLASF